MNRRNLCAAGIAVVIVCSWTKGSLGGPYSFQIIAKHGDVIDGLDINSFSGGSPSLNDLGQVVYVANMALGSSDKVLVQYQGGSSSIIARQNTSFMGHTLTSIFDEPAINNSGNIAFRAQIAAGNAIFSTNSGKIVDVNDSIGGDPVFNLNHAPDINNNGVVAYTAQLDSGNHAVRHTTALIGPGDSLTDLTSVNFLHGSPTSINDFGVVATEARIINGGITGIITTDEPFAKTGQVYSGATWGGGAVGGSDPVINNSEQIIWKGNQPSNAPTLFSNFGYLVAFGDGVDGKTIGQINYWDLSHNGNVAFSSSLGGGGSGLFYNYINVVASGDTIDGHTVGTISNVSLNELGQIAFFAILDGGDTSAVIFATPIPEPGSLVLAAIGAGMGLPAIWRRQRRRTMSAIKH